MLQSLLTQGLLQLGSFLALLMVRSTQLTVSNYFICSDGYMFNYVEAMALYSCECMLTFIRPLVLMMKYIYFET